MTDEVQIKAVMELAVAGFGGLDGLFNNAGKVGALNPLDDLSVESWRAVQDLLVTSVFLGTKHAIAPMSVRGGGSIVNTASIAALEAGWGPVAYSTAKAGVLHFSRVAAAELAAKKIRVNAICPGLIATSIFGTALGMPVEQADQLAAFVGQAGHDVQPVGRAGRPSDIGEAVVMLMSDAGSFITGTHFVIDGGITMGPRHAWDPTVVSPLATLLGIVESGQT